MKEDRDGYFTAGPNEFDFESPPAAPLHQRLAVLVEMARERGFESYEEYHQMNMRSMVVLVPTLSGCPSLRMLCFPRSASTTSSRSINRWCGTAALEEQGFDA